MNERLKTLENLTELLYAELKEASHCATVNEKTYTLLKDASVDAINLKRKIEVARAWLTGKM